MMDWDQWPGFLLVSEFDPKMRDLTAHLKGMAMLQHKKRKKGRRDR